MSIGFYVRAYPLVEFNQKTTRLLDDGFFKVRFDRRTPKDREYVTAMAQLGPGPYRSAGKDQGTGRN